MTSNARTFCGIVFGLALGSLAQLAHAQQQSAGAAYDQGVNAFFAGRSSQAEMLLSEAMQFNPQDPRVYYFRALSLLRQGRRDEARGDMMVGAQLEAQTPQRYAIGTALERIQGCDRLMLEEFRRSARRDVVQQTSATQRVSQPARPSVPSIMNGSDAAVLRENHVVPLDELVRPGGPRTFAEQPAEETPPQDKAAAAAEAQPPADAAKANPFTDDAQPAATEPAAAPAAAAPATPRATPPQAPPPTPPQANPAPAATPPAAPANPAKPPVEAEENPFG